MGFRKAEQPEERNGNYWTPRATVKSVARKVRPRKESARAAAGVAGEILESTGDLVTTLWLIDAIGELLDN